MRYQEAVLAKIEKLGNMISNIDSSISRGNYNDYQDSLTKMKELQQEIYSLVAREEQE